MQWLEGKYRLFRGIEETSMRPGVVIELLRPLEAEIYHEFEGLRLVLIWVKPGLVYLAKAKSFTSQAMNLKDFG